MLQKWVHVWQHILGIAAIENALLRLLVLLFAAASAVQKL
jgi:hypothetical protein